MSLILIIILLIIVFGGGGGYYAHSYYGGPGLGGVLGVVLIVLVVLWLSAASRSQSYGAATRDSACEGSSAPDLDAAPAILPIHIEETTQSIARLHAEHHANATQHRARRRRYYINAGPPRLHRRRERVDLGCASVNGLA